MTQGTNFDLFRAGPNAMVLVDEDGRILDANQPALTLFQHEDLVGRVVEDLVPRDVKDRHRANRDGFFHDPQPRPMGEGRQLAARKKDGTEFPVEISLCPVATDLGPAVVATIVDITLLRSREKEIQQFTEKLEAMVEEKTRKLQAANHELETFISTVSHDLKAPLRGLSGFGQALREDFGSLLPDQGHFYLDQIDVSTRHLSDLIEGLLTLSRISEREFSPRNVDVSQFIGEWLRQRAGEPETLPVEWTIEPGLGCWADPYLMQVLVGNLLDNAWKYTAKAAFRRIEVFRETLDGKDWISIRDNGAGFDMAYQGLLFLPFQRLHRQDEFPGLGIGLATCFRIVERMDGELRARGTVGEGATFSFRFP